MLNYSKKLDRKIFILGLVIFAVFLLATTIQTDFAATNPINNTTAGGISGALNSSSPGDIIELGEGTYTGNNNTNMTINKNITIQGKSKDKVILDAQELSRIYIIGNNLNVTFINITFINGNTGGNGGAIVNLYAGTILTFVNCTFANNSANNGGAIETRGNISIQGSNFTNNSCNGNGGAVHISTDNFLAESSFNVIDSNFLNNSCNINGGAIGLDNHNATIISGYIINSIFIDNIASRFGGAIFLNNPHNTNNNYLGKNYNVNISNSIFINNTAARSGGSIMITTHNNSTGNLDIINSEFKDNIAAGSLIYNSDGGAIYIATENTVGIFNANINVNIIGCNFINNFANNNGGAIKVNTGNNASGNLFVHISSSNFTNNTANNDGGAIKVKTGENSTANCTVIVGGSDLSGNSAGNDGGALSSNTGENSSGDSTVIVGGSDLSGNSAGNDGGAVSSSTGEGSSGDSTVIIDDSTINDNNAGNNGGALSSNTGENSTGNSIIIVIDSDIENNTAGNNGDTASATTGDGSSGDSEIDIIGDSTIINNNPDKDDDGIYTSTGENSTGNSEINIDDGVIKKLSSNSTIIVSNTVVGKTVVIRGVAIDENGNPLANIQLTINIDGVDYNVTTNALGEWSLNYTPSSPGTITVTVDLNENNKYYAFTNTTDFNIAKANTRSTIIISNATSGKSTIIRGVLIDENGNTIANAPINLVIGGKSNNLVTDADGSWSLSYTPAKAGKFIAKVYYNGNNNYVASTSSLNYTVAQGIDAPKKTDIRLLKKKSSKVFRHGKRVVMKWYTYKNYGATGSKNITTKVIIKNLKYKLWKVYNKKLSYKYGNNKIKFKLNLKSGEKFKLKLKVYKTIR